MPAPSLTNQRINPKRLWDHLMSMAEIGARFRGALRVPAENSTRCSAQTLAISSRGVPSAITLP